MPAMRMVNAAPIVTVTQAYSSQIAVRDKTGTYSYTELQTRAREVAAVLVDREGCLRGSRIAFMVTPGFDYVAILWGIWRAGAVAVPIGLGYPAPEIDYILADTQAELVISDDSHVTPLFSVASRRKCRSLNVKEIRSRVQGNLPDVGLDQPALILYTSGTTSKPKGVVTSHRNITEQIKSLVSAWEWSQEDKILNVLPLHHVHGIINIVCCALWSGASCQFLPGFDVTETFRTISQGHLTLFMAVPTIYSKLIAAWEQESGKGQARFTEACSKMRLMVSGSAALPVQVLEKWRSITGHTLLERYGMTEIGMALSNPLHGDRKPGMVGFPLPGVTVQLSDDQGREIQDDGISGEIWIKGQTVFQEYWQRPEATRAAFQDGWFRTGDIAVIEDGYYRILGRDSIDIIKSGGFKVSALEIEEVLRGHPSIAECSVVGIPDPEWGERVALVAVLQPGQSLELNVLRGWARTYLSKAKIPTRLEVVKELPRNAMGKVVKPEVRKLFE